MANQLAFYVDIAACSGCKACQIACKDRKDLPVGIKWRRVFEYGGGEWIKQDGFMVPTADFTYYVSAACMHCQNPMCLEVCPAAAISKRDDGIVLIDPDKCIGCRYCQWACPYGAPQFNEELGVMTKCDFCYELQDQGQNPACVDACPMRALHYGELEELQAQYGTLADPAPLPDPSITHPSIVYKPNSLTQTSAGGKGEVMNVEEVKS